MSISVAHFVDLLSLCPFTITADKELRLFPHTHLVNGWRIQSDIVNKTNEVIYCNWLWRFIQTEWDL